MESMAVGIIGIVIALAAFLYDAYKNVSTLYPLLDYLDGCARPGIVAVTQGFLKCELNFI